MFNFFNGIKKNNELKNKFNRICKSIDFSNSHNHMPTLEFSYTLKDNMLKIEGPVNSFYNIEPYVLTYITTSDYLTFNGEVVDTDNFGHLHKTIKEVHRKILKREDFIKGFKEFQNKISSGSGRIGSGSSDYDRTSSHSDVHRHRSSDVNTDFIYSSSDSCSRSSDRDRNCDD